MAQRKRRAQVKPQAVELPGVASEIIMRPPATLKAFERNARIHDEDQVDKICASIRRFGFTVPLLIDVEADCEIIAGHGRQLAALKMGLPAVPTIDARWLTEDERRAYRLADNKLMLDSEWDEDFLVDELADLDAAGFDLSFTGFSTAELKGFGVGGLGDGGEAPNTTAPERWAVIIECANEADQVALIARLEGEGRKARGAVG